jgi:hypothetical protein
MLRHDFRPRLAPQEGDEGAGVQYPTDKLALPVDLSRLPPGKFIAR